MKRDKRVSRGLWLVCLVLLLLTVKAVPQDHLALQDLVRSKLQTSLLDLLTAYKLGLGPADGLDGAAGVLP